MRVTQELVTVLPDPIAGEIHVVLAGLKISLLPEEAASLAREVAFAIERLRSGRDSEGGPAWSVRPSAPPPAAAASEPERRAEADAMQQRTRALVQAMMREKGLSLRSEEEP